MTSVLRGVPACDFLGTCIAHEQTNWISVSLRGKSVCNPVFIHHLHTFCGSEKVFFQAKAVGDTQSLLIR